MIRSRVLGTVELRDAQGQGLDAILRRPKLLALLGYLAAARPYGFHRRDTLVALLWPEADTAHARNALRQAVHALRADLGRDAIVSRGEDELAINEASLWCDVRDCATSLDAGHREQSLDLYRGELLSGLHVSDVPEFERWLDEEREHLRRRACEAAQALTDGAEQSGNSAAAIRWAQHWTGLAAFDETAVRRLMELLDQAGDRAGAIRAYEELERRLARDLEVQPSIETQRLVTSIRTRRHPDHAPIPVAEAAARSEPRQADLSPATPPDRRIRRTWSRSATALTLLVGILLGGWFFVQAHGHAAAARTPKRLVVLPFENLGDPQDEYFADGITEEITTRLATIGAFRVIGNTSAYVYKGSKKGIPEIGRELGADYVLEGRVRWEKTPQGPARVRVTPQLVRTNDDTHLWADEYDEPLDEIFRVQSDIAQQVVRQLDISLLEEQRRVMEAAPTRNLEAYDYYLRGNDYVRRGVDERTAPAALLMYQKAVELDTSFALAYAMLSRAHTRMYWFHYDRSAERLALAKRAVDKAFALDPDLPEAHQSLGNYYFFGLLDYDRALREYAIAEASRPNDVDLFSTRGFLRMRQGKFREALADYETARKLDPASPSRYSDHAQVYSQLRDFAGAESLYARARGLRPDWPNVYADQAWLYCRWDGATRRARAALEEARAAGVNNVAVVLHIRVVVDILDRRYEDALGLLRTGAPEAFDVPNRFVPRAQLMGQTYGFMHRRGLERIYYDSSRALVLRKLLAQPDDARLYSALGIALAGLGLKNDAIRAGQHGVELLPISKEARLGYNRELDLARIYTMVGESDMAIQRVERLLSLPGFLTRAWLRIDPTYDPLRSNPRFQELLAGRP